MKTKTFVLTILTASLIAGCADTTARNQIADTNQKLTVIQQNVGVLDNKVSNQKVLDLLNQVSDLQNQINQLNGQLANLENLQKTSSTDVSQQLQSLDLRITALEGGSSTTQSTTNTPNSTNAKLQAAINNIKNNHNTLAITQLRQIMMTTTDKNLALNAKYLLCVAYVSNAQYSVAIKEANAFIAIAGTNSKVPDAMRIIYISQTQLGNTSAANEIAQKLQEKYPNSDAAKKVGTPT